MTTRAAADIVCKLPSKITTIGIDVWPGHLFQTEAVYHLQFLGRNVTSRFPKLSRILIRLEDDDTLLDTIYNAFGQALGILEVEVLPSVKRSVVRDFTDDCFSKRMSG
jgi:hypothetical protein